MAILRGGRRIGNFDFRLGLPRDKSLVDINSDPRLARKPGGNPESTINRFLAQVSQGEGVSRPSRYLVVFYPPKRIKPLTEAELLASEHGGGSAGTRNDLDSYEMSRNVGMMCNKVTMPSRDVNTAPHNMYGPARKMPYAYSFSGELQMTFYGDKYLRQRQYFENWQKKIFDNVSHNMNYYDDYVGTMDIYQLGAFAGNADRDRISYAVRLFECYPQTIGSYDYGYDQTDQAVNIPITMNFRTWSNLTLDQINGAEIGKAFADAPTIKASKDFGLFGGILNRLPPEIRRVGRDILQTTKRNLPIGKITGGRVFPPFL